MRSAVLILWVSVLIIGAQEVSAQNVEYVGAYSTPGTARAVFAPGDYAYVADGDSGLQIVDVSDPFTPVHAGSLAMEYPTFDVRVSGDYAFVGMGVVSPWGVSDGGLEVVDVSDPAIPDSVSAWDGFGVAQHVFVSGDFAYVGTARDRPWGTEGEFEIIDVSDPDNPVLAWETFADCGDNGPGFGDVFVSGDYAYIACETAALVFEIWNVSDPYHPALAGAYAYLPGHRGEGIFVAGDYAYLASSQTLSILDVSDPNSPQPAGSYDTPGQARDVFVSGHYAYVADGDAGLQIIDVTDPAHPVLAGSYDTPGDARGVYVRGDYTYVADSSSLVILRFAAPSAVELSGFDATSLPTAILLTWSTSFEADHLGFRVHRAPTANGDYMQLSELIEPPGPYRYLDTELTGGATYFYRLEAVDRSGGSEFYGPVEATAPAGTGSPRFTLSQNQPNPFVAERGATTIGFVLGEPAPVRLRVFDPAGRLVRLLVNAPLDAGQHAAWWDGRNDGGTDLGSGIYYYRLDAGGFSESRTLVKLR